MKIARAFEDALNEVANPRTQEIEITPSNFQTKTCWFLKKERENSIRERLKLIKSSTSQQLKSSSKVKGETNQVVLSTITRPSYISGEMTISQNKTPSWTLKIGTPFERTDENYLSNVFENLKRNYSFLDQAILIKTPLPQKRSLYDLWFSLDMLQFIEKFEPKAKDGIFLHQWELLMAYLNGARNFVLTSSTGSGKSLCFWTWVIDNLFRNPDQTALVCFPTQALVWSQAERLAQASDFGSLKRDNEGVYSGVLKIGKQKIGWTVWKGGGFGFTRDQRMREHESTPEFLNARIRISTLDKANWSLIKDYPEFTKQLNYIVLDEAHCYDGVFGANVHYFLERVKIAKEYWGTPGPQIFLSSATLNESLTFASQLTGIDAKHFYFQSDPNKQEVFLIPLEKVQDFIQNPPKDGLTRVILLIDSLLNNHGSFGIEFDDKGLGDEVNAIFFSESKIESRLLKWELDSKIVRKRESIIYDADLTPLERRSVEGKFNRNQIKGVNLIATSALELGVDIENLDVCFINDVPARKVELLQRIGRVGRRVGKLGIVILRLGPDALDRIIARNPVEALKSRGLKTVPIPENAELQKLKNIVASYKECLKSYSLINDPPKKFLDLQKKYFGSFNSYYEVFQDITQNYPGLVDTNDPFWYLKGFRSNLNQRKIPLKEEKGDVAWIDELSIFRDAHPEAIYLDSHCRRWRVINYSLNLRSLTKNQSGMNAIKFANSISAVIVALEKGMKFTRGVWKDSFTFLRETPLANLKKGAPNLKCGVWEFQRRFDGYFEIDLNTREKRRISLFEVSKRFKLSKSFGEGFPYLQPFSYITHGWSVVLSPDAVLNLNFNDEALIALVESILSSFFSEVVNCSPTDLIVKIDPQSNGLMVLDATPGGSGISFALIKHDLIKSALKKAIQIMTDFEKNELVSPGFFKNYVEALSNESHNVSPGILIRVFLKLRESL